MTFPRHSTARTPRDLREAIRMCKDHARERKRLSVERLADLLDVTVDTLYKWMADGRLPASKIPAFEHACGVHYVTEYLAGGAGRIVIQIPAGHPADAESIAGLQAIMADATAKLIRCYRGQASIEETRDGLTVTLQALAWHRSNVTRLDQPELGLPGDGDA
jgi:transcriptional regulator with XRE-family HTH domain